MEATKFSTVEGYFAAAAPEAREQLAEMRSIIRKAAPGAEEAISYNIPSFKWQGMLVWYGAAKHHIGFYPRLSAKHVFAERLKQYPGGKGTIQFVLDKPLPAKLITDIVKFRMKENEEAAARKGTKKGAGKKAGVKQTGTKEGAEKGGAKKDPVKKAVVKKGAVKKAVKKTPKKKANKVAKKIGVVKGRPAAKVAGKREL